MFSVVGQEAQKYIKAGKLVPDETMIKFISGELKNVHDKSWLLDGMKLSVFENWKLIKNNFIGFPRTLAQAEALWNVEKMDLALNLVVPFQIIIERVKGRWIHLPSGRVYNEGFNSPKVLVSFWNFLKIYLFLYG